MSTLRFLIGTYSEEHGIYELTLPPRGEPEVAAVTATGRNSYLAKAGDICYAVSEVPLAAGYTGKLHSFRILEKGLEPVDTLDGLPPLLPHLAVNAAGTVLYTASYGTGEILAIALADGKFGQILSRTRNVGSSVDPRRQTCAHPHSVWLTPDEKRLFLCDLGTDEVVSWPLDDHGRIVVEERRSLAMPKGYGPRHLVFSPDGSKAWVLTEMAWHVLEITLSDGSFRDISLEGTLPRAEQGGGAIRLTSDGHLLCSNRSMLNSRIDLLDTRTMAVTETLTRCLWPRDFCLSRDENWLLCANQKADSCSLFRKNGECWEFAQEIEGIPEPACVLEITYKNPASK